MERLEFLILGSQGDQYKVVFERDGDNLNAHCYCPSGIHRRYCKHLSWLMDGDVTRLASGNEDDVSRLKSMLTATGVEGPYERYAVAEKHHQQTTKELTKAKASLMKVIHL